MSGSDDRSVQIKTKLGLLESLRSQRSQNRPTGLQLYNDVNSTRSLGKTSLDVLKKFGILDDDSDYFLRPLTPEHVSEAVEAPEAPAELPSNGVMNGTSNHVAESTSAVPPPRPGALEVVNTGQITIVPKSSKANGAYCKTTQTDDERISVNEFSLGSPDDFDFDEYSTGDKADINYDESPSHEIAQILSNLNSKQFDRPIEPQQPERIPELSEEEKRQLLQSEDFVKVFSKSSKVLERHLAQMDDLCTDYSYDYADSKVSTGESLTFNREFIDEAVSGCAVNCLTFSSFHPELIATSYDHTKSLELPAGVVNVWSTKFKTTTPEYTFYAPSRVTSLQFADFHPNILLGGLSSGQICAWDNRVTKRTPVQKSLMATSAHIEPIPFMKIVGSQNAHNLVTLSCDGKICTWSLDNLASPITSANLAHKQKKNHSMMTAAFLKNNINNFVAGDEDGSILYSDKLGQIAKYYPVHEGPVTAVATHQAQSNTADFSSVILSASNDSTICLTDLNSVATKPFLTLEHHRDYVLDAQWSPTHPAVFASVDIEGMLNLWNLNSNNEMPVSSINLGEYVSATRVLWSANGQQLVVSDNRGRLIVYNVHERFFNVHADEWTDFDRLLNELKDSQATSSDLKI